MNEDSMEKTIAWEVVVRVHGFDDAFAWIYRMVGAGIVECTLCNNPATHVHWIDRAEWYPHCDDHRDYGDMWVGHTGWNPITFSLTVIHEAAQVWVNQLEADEQKRVKLRTYDATDYWSLLVNVPWEQRDRITLDGVTGTRFHAYAEIKPLTNGYFVYEITREMHPVYHSYGLVGAFATRDEAVAAATKAYEDKTY